jgi:hypothetical protein
MATCLVLQYGTATPDCTPPSSPRDSSPESSQRSKRDELLDTARRNEILVLTYVVSSFEALLPLNFASTDHSHNNGKDNEEQIEAPEAQIGKEGHEKSQLANFRRKMIDKVAIGSLQRIVLTELNLIYIGTIPWQWLLYAENDR